MRICPTCYVINGHHTNCPDDDDPANYEENDMSQAMFTAFFDLENDDGNKPCVDVRNHCDDPAASLIVISLKTDCAAIDLHCETLSQAIEIGEQIARAGRMAERRNEPVLPSADPFLPTEEQRNEESQKGQQDMQAQFSPSSVAFASPERLQEMIEETSERR